MAGILWLEKEAAQQENKALVREADGDRQHYHQLGTNSVNARLYFLRTGAFFYTTLFLEHEVCSRFSKPSCLMHECMQLQGSFIFTEADQIKPSWSAEHESSPGKTLVFHTLAHLHHSHSSPPQLSRYSMGSC